MINWNRKYVGFIGVMLISFFSFAQNIKSTSIYFDFNKFEISDASKAILNETVSLSANSFSYSVKINAYTDSKGTNEYNEKLAKRRFQATYDYLIANGIKKENILESANREDLSSVPDNLRRKATIELSYTNPKTYYGTQGTQVIGAENNPITISEYFSPKEMIRDGMYALDEDGQVLRSDGMITICFEKATLDATGKFYIIKMPSRDGTVINSMSVYLRGKDENGELRWRRTVIPYEWDATEKFYIFKLPVESEGCVNINLDCRVLPAEKVVYVTPAATDIFDNVRLTNGTRDLSFSAKKDVNTYVFVCSKNVNTFEMVLIGSKKNVQTEIRLNGMALETKPNSDEYYTVSHYGNGRERHFNKKEETGFWAWLRRVFS